MNKTINYSSFVKFLKARRKDVKKRQLFAKESLQNKNDVCFWEGQEVILKSILNIVEGKEIFSAKGGLLHRFPNEARPRNYYTFEE